MCLPFLWDVLLITNVMFFTPWYCSEPPLWSPASHFENLCVCSIVLSDCMVHVPLRAPAPALQPSERQLGPGVGPPHEKTLGWSGRKTSRGTRTKT